MDDVKVPKYVRQFLESRHLELGALRGMSMAEIRGRGASPRVVEWIAKYLGRGEEIGRDDLVEVLPGVTLGMVKSRRGLKGTWRYFGYEDRESFDRAGITDEQVAEYILSRRVSVREEERVRSGGARSRGRRLSREEVQRELDRRLGEVLALYNTDNLTDRENLRRLVFMEWQSEQFQNEMLDLRMRGDAQSRRDEALLAEQHAKLSKEIRDLQKVMGIDRASREVVEREDPLDVVTAGLEDAKWLLDNEIQVVEHRCADGRVVRPIMLIWHFFPTHPHETFRQECPNCGQVLEVECKRRGYAVKASDFDISDLVDI